VLATRLLDQSKADILFGTENALDPFFSPDSKWIGFFAEQKMKKISVQGGAAVALCDTLVGLPRGASWGTNGYIIANLDNIHLSRVPEAGGKPEIIATPADRGMRTYRWPQVLPGAQAVLFTSGTIFAAYEDANIEVLSLQSGKVKTVHRGGYFGRYLPSGHLVYVHQGTLFGMPFDLGKLEARGTPVPLLDDVAAASSYGSGQLDLSQAGILCYLSGKSGTDSGYPLIWIDAAGKAEPLLTPPSQTLTPRLSPDGKRLACTIAGSLAVYDPQRNTTMRLTFNTQRNLRPLWTADGKHLLFDQDGSEYAILWIRADGSGQAEKLYGAKQALAISSLSPDGRRVAFSQQDPNTGMDLWTLPLDLSEPDHPKPGKPEPFLREPSDQIEAAFSPDGHWMAYTTLDPGGPHVFVRPFPGASGAGRWQVSTVPGRFPTWSRNGRELFYLSSDDHIMVATYTARGDSFNADRARQWSPVQIAQTGIYPPLDLAPDGKRFAVLSLAAQGGGGDKTTVHVTVLLNFFDELRRRVPVK
jgi:serine/threonine-protein kinase